MIPLKQGATISVDAKDGSGKLHLRYLVGEAQDTFFRLQSAKDGLQSTRLLVDTFLAGWEGDGWPEFPKDGQPSKMLRLGDLNDVAEIINEHTEELTGITVGEVKNSQRPRSSSGRGRRRRS